MFPSSVQRLIDNLWGALLPAVLYLGIHLIEGETITPMLLARRFTLNPVLIILSLIFWYWMGGCQARFWQYRCSQSRRSFVIESRYWRPWVTFWKDEGGINQRPGFSPRAAARNCLNHFAIGGSNGEREQMPHVSGRASTQLPST